MIWALLGFNTINLIFGAIAIWQRERSHASAMSAKDGQIADLLDRLQEMVGQIHYHQVQKAAAPAAPETPRQPMWVSEDEQDIQHAFDAGMIDKKALEAALEELNFMNTEVDIEFS